MKFIIFYDILLYRKSFKVKNVEIFVENEENFLKNLHIPVLKVFILANFFKYKGDSMENQTNSKNILNFCKISDKAIIPTRATDGAAGYDLFACIEKEITLNPKERVLIPCGISISLPSKEYAAFIFARSGLGIKNGITLSNGVGVVDSDYRGEICVGLFNSSSQAYTFKPQDRIAQMVIMKVEVPILNEVSSLDSTARGNKGFGSTGK